MQFCCKIYDKLINGIKIFNMTNIFIVIINHLHLSYRWHMQLVINIKHKIVYWLIISQHVVLSVVIKHIYKIYNLL